MVSFFDPDGLVNRLQLGRIARTVDEMREAVQGLVDIPAYRENIGRRAREYAQREFTTGVAARYLDLLSFDGRVPVHTADGGSVS